ncbi:MAG TPA: hypothetical protein VGF32_10715 [Streptosporangiaceae bacterium]|jgi:hypothetical protein
MRLTLGEAEELLTEWAAVMRSRDDRVRAAVAAGMSKNRVHVLTGIGRMTIDRILASGQDHGPSTAQAEGIAQ